MSFTKTLMTSVSALMLAGAFATSASATNLSTGGSSLIAPYIAQVWGARTGSNPTTPYPGTSSISSPVNTADHVQLWNSATSSPYGTQKLIASSPDTDSSPNSVDTFNYLSSNSTGGIRGFFSADKTRLGSDGANAPSGFSQLGVPYLGLADAALTAEDINVYNNGGTDSAFNTISFRTDSTASNTSPYMRPAARWGALIQMPFSVDPVAFGYNPTNLNIATADGKLHLDKAAYCGIFNGSITNWNDSHLQALNGGTQLNSNLAIKLVGRTPGSGTTSIFTRHLADVCSSSAGYYSGTNHYYLDSTGADGFVGYTTLPGGVAFYHTNSSSGGVATDLGTVTGTIGYIGADFVDPANSSTQATTYTIPAASLQVGSGSTFVQPTAANAVTAYNTASPPSGSDRADPSKWVAFVTNPSTGYPVVGTTNVVMGTCYASARLNTLINDGSGSTPEGFLHWYYRNTNTIPGDILSNAALGTLPAAWNTAINETFITNTSGLNLNIRSSC